jgi:NAD(P)-dependent dehydrogenase (short-subunit alcohol dehydrogenase family)
MELQGSVALITGAGSGIGRASAIKLAREEASVAAIGRTESELLQTIGEIEKAGGRGIALVADVALEDGMREAIARTVEAFGRIDIVVANAGINGVWAPIDDLRPDEWDKTIAINLRGTYLTLHYAVPHLKAAGGGSIIIMSSINGTRTFTTAGASAYAATKAAQLALAQQLALELGKHRIRVNAVCPGQIDTAIPDNTFKRKVDEARVPVVWPDGDIPITGGKPGQSEDVADVVVFLASPRSRHITGTPIWIDGGQSLLR